MPFDVPGMTAAIVDINANPPATEQEVADRWAAALRTFFAPIANPLPLPGILDAAEAAASAAMAPLIAPVPGVGASSLAAAWAAFAGVLAAGFTPPVVAAVPPPAPYVPPALPPINDANIPAAAIASTTALWAITGTTTTPPAVVAPWA